MLFTLALVCLFAVTSWPVGCVSGDIHQFGPTDTRSNLLLSKQLITDSTPDLRTYTVVFKLLDGIPYTQVTCVRLTIPGNGTSYLVGDVNIDRNRSHSLELMLRIPDTRHLSVHLEVFSQNFMTGKRLMSEDEDSNGLIQMSKWLHYEDTRRRELQSFTVVHVQKTPASILENDRHRYNAIGRRQLSDRLLFKRHMNVTRLNKIAAREFEYVGNDRTLITYVGFEFDSPTAVAFLNSSYCGDNQISAVLYDLSASEFTANITVYGYDLSPGNPVGQDRPEDFKSLVRR